MPRPPPGHRPLVTYAQSIQDAFTSAVRLAFWGRQVHETKSAGYSPAHQSSVNPRTTPVILSLAARISPVMLVRVGRLVCSFACLCALCLEVTEQTVKRLLIGVVVFPVRKVCETSFTSEFDCPCYLSNYCNSRLLVFDSCSGNNIPK